MIRLPHQMYTSHSPKCCQYSRAILSADHGNHIKAINPTGLTARLTDLPTAYPEVHGFYQWMVLTNGMPCLRIRLVSLLA